MPTYKPVKPYEYWKVNLRGVVDEVSLKPPTESGWQWLSVLVESRDPRYREGQLFDFGVPIDNPNGSNWGMEMLTELLMEFGFTDGSDGLFISTGDFDDTAGDGDVDVVALLTGLDVEFRLRKADNPAFTPRVGQIHPASEEEMF